MEIERGQIVFVKVVLNNFEDYKLRPLLVIDKLNYNDYIGLPITSQYTDRISKFEIIVGNKNLKVGSIPKKSRILIYKPYVFSKHICSKIYAEVQEDFLNVVIRKFIKKFSNTYFDIFAKTTKKKDYISPSGKMLGKEELENMIDASLDMWLTSGRFNEKFEEKFRNFFNINYALTVNSGSSANLLAIAALTSSKLGERQLKEGDEVITVAAGFPTTVTSIIQNKLIPVFVDVDLSTYNIDVTQIEKAISKRTRAIFVAHTLGNPFNIKRVLEIAKKYNLWVIEDNCDALGAKVAGKYTGTFGDIATFSFYPAHHITMGEGGAVITNNPVLYKILLSVRDWGRDCWCLPGKDNTCGIRFNQQHGKLPFGYDHKYVYSHLGYNLKLTDWQAAIGLAQLKKLPEFINKRQENFKLLYNGLKYLSEYLILPEYLSESEPSWFGFPITVTDKINKMKLVQSLEENGIGTRQLFAGNMLRQPAFIENDIQIRILNSDIIISSQITEKDLQKLPNSDIIMNKTFWIGLWPGIEYNIILEVFNKVLKGDGAFFCHSEPNEWN